MAAPGQQPPPPPAGVRGMTRLDRTAFQRPLDVCALRLPAADIAPILKLLKTQMLRVPHLRPVQPLGELPLMESCGGGEPGADAPAADSPDQKVVLLDPGRVPDAGGLPWSGLEPLGLSAADSPLRLTLRLTYDNYRADAVLRAVLPDGQDGCTSFSRVGHLIHLNLKEHLLPYGELIGQVLMDKHPGVRTVVNKLNTIDNTFRNFSMQLLAGEADYLVEARENGCSFRMDFSKVYWNPRLCTEHERLVSQLQPEDTLFDACAGVGPFTVPAARKRCRVLANDLNPESFRWLQHNVTANKVQDRVQTFNMDGREFIRTEVRRGLRERLAAPAAAGRLHVVLNLPALAIQFVDAFVGLLSPDEVPADQVVPLRAHVYTFTKELSAAERSVTEALCTNVGRDVSRHVREVFLVRNVAPNKLMYRVTWDVPAEVLCAMDDGPVLKKAKLTEP
ncbi:tRNA (guanine(37)-N1)-methyltransferase [Amphibalanus amphitrite]|uniref:tRNA (guanine(37)-N1)-methyltransferase n=1 Tax=Amphibalanus amphitrite TaxID=1232801 RepID=A0A6A4XCS4_AMPAM|nr:tRNA (guanine(37)-N1)-methyltransferase [Amphibalanus amphitrite]